MGGEISVTSDYILRGLSESDGHPAVQLDVHASDSLNDFIGVWTSTRDRHLQPLAAVDLEVYAGHRFDLGAAWSATLTALSYSYIGGSQRFSDDYQELSASVTYLDRWTFSVAAIPDSVRYHRYYRLGRYPAYLAEIAGQWLLVKGLSLTGGAGYYYLTGDEEPDASYAYGDVGLAFERQRWRLELGWFLAQKRAERISAYPVAQSRFAATLSWRF